MAGGLPCWPGPCNCTMVASTHSRSSQCFAGRTGKGRDPCPGHPRSSRRAHRGRYAPEPGSGRPSRRHGTGRGQHGGPSLHPFELADREHLAVGEVKAGPDSDRLLRVFPRASQSVHDRVPDGQRFRHLEFETSRERAIFPGVRPADRVRWRGARIRSEHGDRSVLARGRATWGAEPRGAGLCRGADRECRPARQNPRADRHANTRTPRMRWRRRSPGTTCCWFAIYSISGRRIPSNARAGTAIFSTCCS